MKKYIGGLVLITARALWSYAGSVTVETSTKDNQGNYYGFTLALGLETNALTNPSGILEPLRGDPVSLDSVNILTRTGSSFADAKLAVYTFVADGNVGEFVGLSESLAFVSDTNVGFQFNDLELTVGTPYQFLFVNADATATGLTSSESGNDTLLQLYQAYSLPWGVAVTADQYSGTLLPSGWGVYKNNTLNAWEGHRMPVVSLTVSSVSIPEFSAFGLFAGFGTFLFALSGHRRRKLAATA